MVHIICMNIQIMLSHVIVYKMIKHFYFASLNRVISSGFRNSTVLLLLMHMDVCTDASMT